MYKGLIHIKYCKFFLKLRKSWWWQLNAKISHFMFFNNSNIIWYELKSLNSLHKMLLMQSLLRILSFSCISRATLRNFSDKLIQRIIDLFLSSFLLIRIELNLIWGKIIFFYHLIMLFNIVSINCSSVTHFKGITLSCSKSFCIWISFCIAYSNRTVVWTLRWIKILLFYICSFIFIGCIF